MNSSVNTAIALSLLLAASALAQVPAPARQDPAALRQLVESFLRVQTTGLPGAVTVGVGNVDPRLNLPACAAPEAFLPNGSRLWGKTTVGVRCAAPGPWTVYLSATVKVVGGYIVTAAPLAQGQQIGPDDLAKIKGDLTSLPHGIITDASQAIGRTISASLPLGSPLRTDLLRAQQAIQQGQVVRVVSSGTGFQVTAEARALNNANEGQVAQVRTSSGHVVTGIAKVGGVVEVTY